MSSLDYKKSGVDTDAGDSLVDWLNSSECSDSEILKKSKISFPDFHSMKERVVSGVGGFASLFDIRFPNMNNPCLITCTDGVGTKVLLASQFQNYSSVGQDLVAMCVNDLVTTGGKPLLFLDYYATSKLDLNSAQEFLVGVRKACLQSQCLLVGGETAEMPGVYKEKDFDCAGFSVGIVDKDKAWGASKVQVGDIVIGVNSSGFHSNGYSLLRKVFESDLSEWQNILLKPTALYVELCSSLENEFIHAAAHITGGGVHNIPRVLPSGLGIQLKKWDFPKEFLEVQKRTQMSSVQMLETLNCGIGFVFIVNPKYVSNLKESIEKHNFKFFELGRVEKADTPLDLSLWE